MFDIVLVGGGLVGLSFALDLAMRRPDFNLLIIERNSYKKSTTEDFDSRIYAISPQNLDYLHKLHVHPNKNRIGVIERMEVFGDQYSNLELDSQQNRYLYLSKTIEYKNLHDTLYEAICALNNVQFLYDDIQDIQSTSDTVTIKFAKHDVQTRFIVGADGANSIVRNKFNISAKIYDYGCSGVVANFDTELAHKNTAYQWFKDGTVMAFLPLIANKISIVWSTSYYQKLLDMSNEDFEREVALFSGCKLGELKLISRPIAFPLKLYTLNQIHSQRMILIGDAAHTIHPLAGQGVNLGFGDARILADILSKLTKDQMGNIGILNKYNARRILKVRQMQLTCHYLHLLFKSDNHAVSLLRNFGLNIVNNMPLVKKYLIKQAVSY